MFLKRGYIDCVAFAFCDFVFIAFCFQVLRHHIMVRVGGGWDTLEHYLDKHDPCRCQSKMLQIFFFFFEKDVDEKEKKPVRPNQTHDQ